MGAELEPRSRSPSWGLRGTHYTALRQAESRAEGPTRETHGPLAGQFIGKAHFEEPPSGTWGASPRGRGGLVIEYPDDKARAIRCKDSGSTYRRRVCHSGRGSLTGSGPLPAPHASFHITHPHVPTLLSWFPKHAMFFLASCLCSQCLECFSQVPTWLFLVTHILAKIPFPQRGLPSPLCLKALSCHAVTGAYFNSA